MISFVNTITLVGLIYIINYLVTRQIEKTGKYEAIPEYQYPPTPKIYADPSLEANNPDRIGSLMNDLNDPKRMNRGPFGIPTTTFDAPGGAEVFAYGSVYNNF